MRKYKEKFLWRNIFYSKFTIVALCLLIFFVSRGVFNLYKKYQITKENYKFVDKELIEAQNKLSFNESKLENINTSEGKEKYIRETYSVKKEGEGVIIIYNSPSSTYEIPKGLSKWDEFKEFLRKFFLK